MTNAIRKYIPTDHTVERTQSGAHRMVSRLMNHGYNTAYKIWLAPLGRARVHHFSPNVSKYFEGLAVNSAVGLGQHLWRALDLIGVLRSYRPKLIHELGSGTSTGIFAAYCNQYDAQLVSFEESQKWYDFNKGELEASELLTGKIDYRFVKSVELPLGSRFSEPLHPQADLVYVDGPFCKTLSATERYPNMDILFHLESGHRPAVIMVDGRWRTVEAILESKAAADYTLTQSANAAATAFDYASYFCFHHHCVFIRKAAS